MIALTFDDGPNPATTLKLLDLLEKNGVAATFFILGERAQFAKAVLKRMAESPLKHEICNHSWSHKNFKKLSDEQIRDGEILRTQTLLGSVVGADRISKIVRPPGGNITKRQIKFITEEMKFRVVGWDVDPDDWKVRDAKQVSAKVLRTTDGKVVLSHDIYQSTVDAMRVVLPALKARFVLSTVSRAGLFTQHSLI